MQAIGSLLLVIGLAFAAWQATVLHGKDIAIGRVTAIEPYGSSNRGGSTVETANLHAFGINQPKKPEKGRIVAF